MAKWRMGYMPSDGGGDRRGMSLRGKLVYTFLAEDGKELCYVGRDPGYEEKETEWKALPPEARQGKRPPVKYNFPTGFHRGLELFGQHASRLNEPGYREKIAGHGILVVEGPNDVIALDANGWPAVGLCSNRITEAQVTKVARFASNLTNGKVILMLDCQPEGDEGAKQTAWELLQRGIRVRTAWSQKMHNGRFAGRQPESLTAEEMNELAGIVTELRESDDVTDKACRHCGRET